MNPYAQIIADQIKTLRAESARLRSLDYLEIADEVDDVVRIAEVYLLNMLRDWNPLPNPLTEGAPF